MLCVAGSAHAAFDGAGGYGFGAPQNTTSAVLVWGCYRWWEVIGVLVRTALGAQLRRHRVEQRRTLRDISSRARVSLGYLSEVERGQKEPSSELLASICGALSVPLSRLLHDTGEDLALRELLDAELVNVELDDADSDRGIVVDVAA